MNAVSSEKCCSTSMDLLRLAGTSLPRFQGAQPDYVRIENSSCCFLDKVIAELQRPEGPPSGAP